MPPRLPAYSDPDPFADPAREGPNRPETARNHDLDQPSQGHEWQDVELDDRGANTNANRDLEAGSRAVTRANAKSYDHTMKAVIITLLISAVIFVLVGIAAIIIEQIHKAKGGK